MQPIKVLVVEDSMVFRELLVQNLNRDPAIPVSYTHLTLPTICSV